MKRIFILALAFVLLPSLSIADPQLDKEPGVQPQAVRGVQGAAGGIEMPVTIIGGSIGLPSDASTETKQDAAIVILATIDAVLDLILLDTANISSDQATATLQTSSEAILATIDAVLDSILAKIIAAPSTEAKQDDNITQVTAIELNTDSPTGFAGGPVTVTTSATLISAASAPRRSLLIRNSDSNTVLFVGPTSGVTTDSGLPIGTAGASGANGNGGTIIYTHTAAVWGIVASGTAEIRIQSESD